MSKELLTEILEGMHSLNEFISVDLARERLSGDNEHKRQAYMSHLSELMAKVQATHPSIRPRMNTPSWSQRKKPAPLPLPTTEDEPEQEEYVEVVEPADQVEEAEDYLTFSPTQDELQEVYEEMMAADEQQDVYDEPVLPTTETHPDEPSDLYEEPVPTSLETPTPPHSQENSGSGLFEKNTSLTLTSQTSLNLSMVADDWNAVYSDARPKGEKTRVKDLKNIVIKGYLEKLGGKSHKTWQKRYCAISGPLMYFYEKDSSKSYNNCICLPLFHPMESTDFTIAKKKQFSFKLTHTDMATGKKKDYYFRCNSEDIRKKWVQAIKDVCDTANAARVSATLPRMLSNRPIEVSPPMKRRTASVGDEEEVPQELYEEMNPCEAPTEDPEEYVAISPVNQIPEVNSSDESGTEEYIEVKPVEDSAQDDPAFLVPSQQPPPPATPPPSSNQPLPPITLPPPSHRPDPTIDLQRVYTQAGSGISFENVFVALWDFTAGDRDELNLKRGDLVLVNEPNENSEWWYGEALDADAAAKQGRVGFFPQSYSSSAFQAVA